MYFVLVRDRHREGRERSVSWGRKEIGQLVWECKEVKQCPHPASVKPSKCSFFLKIYILIFLLYHKSNTYTLEKFKLCRIIKSKYNFFLNGTSLDLLFFDLLFSTQKYTVDVHASLTYWLYTIPQASLVAQTVKNLPAMWASLVQSLGREDPLEEGIVAHSSIRAWRIPMDRGAWWATAHGLTDSRTRPSD